MAWRLTRTDNPSAPRIRHVLQDRICLLISGLAISDEVHAVKDAGSDAYEAGWASHPEPIDRKIGMALSTFA